MPPRTTPCQNCRQTHSKYCQHLTARSSPGDDGDPKCARCEKTGSECIRPRRALRFLHAVSSTTEYSTLKFIDEESRVDSASPTHSIPTCPSPPSTHIWTDRNRALPQVLGVPSPQNYGPKANISSAGVLDESEIDPFGLLEVPHFAWPRLCPRDACLLRYFVEDLSRWFDLCDPENHFANAVPQRARDSQTLRNAILAASARHFSTLPRERQKEIIQGYGLKQGFTVSEEMVLHYHNECIADLRYLASEPNAIMDEDLLAAVVILRFYEELDSPFIEFSTETAIRGLQVFIEAQASLALASPGFRQAVFWVGFRQEFHIAFAQQRPFRLPLSICEPHLTWTPAPDHVWANRLIIICAHAIQYCYDDRLNQGATRYRELVELYNRWQQSRPMSFSPTYAEDPDQTQGDIFPRIWFMDDCHILASQSMGLLKILLTAYSPHVPRVGPARRKCLAQIDAQLRATVLEICGVALSNRQSPPALITACVAINTCCEQFSDLREQQALLEINAITTRETNYWPASVSKAKLEEAWGWGT